MLAFRPLLSKAETREQPSQPNPESPGVQPHGGGCGPWCGWGGGSQLPGVSLALEVHVRGAIKSGACKTVTEASLNPVPHSVKNVSKPWGGGGGCALISGFTTLSLSGGACL